MNYLIQGVSDAKSEGTEAEFWRKYFVAFRRDCRQLLADIGVPTNPATSDIEVLDYLKKHLQHKRVETVSTEGAL